MNLAAANVEVGGRGSGGGSTPSTSQEDDLDRWLLIQKEADPALADPDQLPVATILIVDDHPITHSGLQLLFSIEPRFQIVGGLHRGAEVASYLANNPVDLVILDLNMPDLRGVSVLAEIIGSHDMAVVVLTGDNNNTEIEVALKLGARAVVSKSEPTSEILAACDAALAGEIYISQTITCGLGCEEQAPVLLSPRQMAVLHYLEQGYRNKEIGYRLSIAPPTVSFHIAELRKKLGVGHNRKIVERAQTLGLI